MAQTTPENIEFKLEMQAQSRRLGRAQYSDAAAFCEAQTKGAGPNGLRRSDHKRVMYWLLRSVRCLEDAGRASTQADHISRVASCRSGFGLGFWSFFCVSD